MILQYIVSQIPATLYLQNCDMLGDFRSSFQNFKSKLSLWFGGHVKFGVAQISINRINSLIMTHQKNEQVKYD